MTLSFPNESTDYRMARNQLLQREIELRRMTEEVAKARRALPPGRGIDSASRCCASISGGSSMVTRTSQGRGVSRGAAQGAAGGSFFLTFFGAYWGFTSAVFLSGTVQVISFLLVGLVTLAFFGRGVMLLRQCVLCPKSRQERMEPEGEAS